MTPYEKLTQAVPMHLLTVLDHAFEPPGLSLGEAYFLLAQSTPEALETIRVHADRLRQTLVGDTATYVVNRNINFTNICNQHCSFCAFRRDEGEEGAYWLAFEQILAKAQAAVSVGATEICMQGGLNPKAKIQGSALQYYLKLVHMLKDAFPHLHLHAFSPQEAFFIAEEDSLTLEHVLGELQAAGVGSMPGTAAEVLYEPVRRRLCGEKLNTQQWITGVKTALKMGIPMTSTLLSGHIETLEQRVLHLGVLRAIQQQVKPLGVTGFTEFILLPYVGAQAPAALRRQVGRDQPILADALLTSAVARLFFGPWIPNHQPSWVKLTLEGAQEALRWGCNDIGGTLMEEHITSMAGAKGGTCMDVDDLRGAIERAGRVPRERDTLYRPVA
nr:7,8-didemethyl-8-hydroxy-5-deazariboflavin synthase subunit CofH [Anthocerotibacter panamensis]